MNPYKNAIEQIKGMKAAKNELTALEFDVMVAMTKDDFWSGVNSIIWADQFSMPNMNQARGAISSLVKKDYICIYDNMMQLTEKGREWFSRARIA